MQLFRLCLPSIITSKVGTCVGLSFTLFFFNLYGVFYKLRSFEMMHADLNLEESKPDIAVFSLKEAYTSILFIHIILRNTSFDHVCSGS